MRYISLQKSGIWQFRFQLRPDQRHHFDGRREIKRSLKTSDKQHAILEALKLEIEIRKTLLSSNLSEQLPTSDVNPPSVKLQRTMVNTATLPINALEQFCDYKKNHISEKALNMLKAKCRTVLDLMDKQNLREIRRRDAENVVQLLRKYPANLKKNKKFDGLSGIAAIKLNERLGFPALSEESVRDYCQKLSGFFEWCVLNELTDLNAFRAIRFKKKRKVSEAKQAYSTSDLQKIFGTKIYTDRDYRYPYYYWLPLLGYFTGARLNELCQLYKADIQKQEEVWVIQIDDKYEGQKLKNPSSRRTVPIHNKLIELGFLNYVHSLQHERVFPELKNTRDGYGSAASRWYGRHKTHLGFRKGYDFHSFRHTFATQLKRQKVSHIIASEILGHSHKSITYDRYGKNLSVIQMYEVVNLIDPNLKIPNDKNFKSK
ncbi:site-specific integrase [Vibrio furnissii]|uniref:site-specific integrase n=1 Tax=Vibrio TaxID=662 RepID=UPI0021601F6C|nr:MULTISPECIES: site-specific integrase [Vibrio]MCS0218082.1 site-specific integrase [Vibrio alginolyticus]WJG26810.1 site-specific integrase [Vibrio furnissii]